MSDHLTIQNAAEGLYKEKGSKFIAYAFRVDSEDEIKSNIESIRKKHYDARHHCYAWILGLDLRRERANDDGEPSHSAGDPILGQIKSFGLTNTLVIVVRYFGGTKLGVGGLIGAYKTAAFECLKEAKLVPLYEKRRVQFDFDYPQLSTIERLISEHQIEVKERNFKEKCSIYGAIKKDVLDSFRRAIENLYNIKISIEE